MRRIPADGFQTAVLLSLLVILGAVTETVSQLVSSGQCPMRVTTELIDATRIHGAWYELERSPSMAEYPLVCIQIIVQQFYDQQAQVQVLGFDRFERKRVHSSGFIKALPDFPHTGHLIRINWDNPALQNYTLQVVQTDYKNYIMLLGCRNYEATAYGVVLWLLGRSRHLSEDIQANITRNIHLLGLGNMKMHALPQHRCT